MRICTRIFLILFFALLVHVARAQTPESVLLSTTRVENPTEAELQLADWQPYHTVSLTDTAMVLWIKITFIPVSSQSVIELTGYVNDFVLYHSEQKHWNKIGRDLNDPMKRPRLKSISLDFATVPRQLTTVYVRVKTIFVEPEVRCFSEEDFQAKKEGELIFFSAILGFLVFVICYNGFFFAVSGERIFGIYGIYVFFMVLSLYTTVPGINRFFSSLFTPHALPDASPPILLTFVANFFANLMCLVYGYHFLEGWRVPAVKNVYTVYFFILCFAFFVVPWLPGAGAGPIVHLLSTITFLVAIGAGIYFWSKGTPFAFLFTLAYVVLLLFYGLKLCSNYGILPFNSFYFTYGILFQVIILAYALGRKIIEEKRAYKKNLFEVNEILMKQNVQLEQFANILGHNLRGPVARVLGLTQLLDKRNPDYRFTLEVMDRVNTSALELDHVIKDIAAILEVKIGNRFVTEKIELKEEMEKAMASVNHQLEEVNAQVTFEWELKMYVSGIRSYMQSIFVHLLENAVKYRDPKRRPELTISLKKEDNSLKVLFADNGIGIDSKYKSMIFEPFKRVHLLAEGRGLGLYFVASQMEAMGGRIEVESEPGKGTLFILTFRSENN